MAIAAPIHKFNIKKPKSLNIRPNAYQRGYGGRRWEIPKHRIFIRDIYYCQDCGILCDPEAMKPNGEEKDMARRPQCDHIIPKSQGGSNNDDNLQTLCGRCHSIKSMRERMV